MNTSDASLKCQHCGAPLHDGTCPKISAIELYENGATKRVEYLTNLVRQEAAAAVIEVIGGHLDTEGLAALKDWAAKQ